MIGEQHIGLLVRVCNEIEKIIPTNDALLLLRWRALKLCSALLTPCEPTVESLCLEALDLLLKEDDNATTHQRIRRAAQQLTDSLPELSGVLPVLPEPLRGPVDTEVDRILQGDDDLIARALEAQTRLEQRFRPLLTKGTLWAGLKYRFERLAKILDDETRPEEDRKLAAASIHYLEWHDDAISDSLGLLGHLDDDHVLRSSLLRLDPDGIREHLHWSERVASLWDDLPFLRGLRLERRSALLPTTWLDRLVSYAALERVLGADRAPLVVMVPSLACTPVHLAATLLGYLVLDGMTDAREPVDALEVGRCYQLGDLVVQFRGFFRPEQGGMLRLGASTCIIGARPEIANRLVRTTRTALSSDKRVNAYLKDLPPERLQQFFGWHSPIGASSLPACYALVTTERRQRQIFGEVSSNGVQLLDSSIFCGVDPKLSEQSVAGRIIRVSSLSVVRRLIKEGVPIAAVLVDGIDKLRNGRHELQFLKNTKVPPRIICLTPTSFVAATTQRHDLSECDFVEIGRDDLAALVELDADGPIDRGSPHEALLHAATWAGPTPYPVTRSDAEESVLQTVADYMSALTPLAEGAQSYHYSLKAEAQELRLWIGGTPAMWSDLETAVGEWQSRLEERASGARAGLRAALDEPVELSRRILGAIRSIDADVNAKAAALIEWAAEFRDAAAIVCEKRSQIGLVTSLMEKAPVGSTITPVSLAELEISRRCIVPGWLRNRFMHRISAYTPEELLVLTDASEQKQLGRIWRALKQSRGESMLKVVGGRFTDDERASIAASLRTAEELEAEDLSEFDSPPESEDRPEPCILVWVAEESTVKVVGRGAKVLVDTASRVVDRNVAELQPGDHVVLGSGTGGWSPTEELTRELMQALASSRGDLIERAREWRRALGEYQEKHSLSAEELRDRLADLGVKREVGRIRTWVDLERAEPIGPQNIDTDLRAMWSILAGSSRFSAEDVSEGCREVRSLRSSAVQALVQLWKGQEVDVDIDETLAEQLLSHLGKTVAVYEVEEISDGYAPRNLLGHWLPPSLLSRYDPVGRR